MANMYSWSAKRYHHVLKSMKLVWIRLLSIFSPLIRFYTDSLGVTKMASFGTICQRTISSIQHKRKSTS